MIQKTIRIFLLCAGLFATKTSSMEEQPRQHDLPSPNREIHIQKIPFNYEIIAPQEQAISIPVDVLKIILNHLAYKKDERSQSTFWATCKTWKNIGDDYFKITYDKENKSYQKKIAITTLPISAIIAGLGVYLFKKNRVIGEGIALGGAGVAIYAIYAASQSQVKALTFLSISILLATSILVAWRQFGDQKTSST